jgi:hypothetical protein
MDKAEIFTNEHPEEKRTTELTEFGGYRRPKHAPIKPADRAWFESLRIRHEDLADVLHEVDLCRDWGASGYIVYPLLNPIIFKKSPIL